MKPVCPVDECGRFNEEITDFKGIYVKDADKLICKYLKVIFSFFWFCELIFLNQRSILTRVFFLLVLLHF